MEVKRVTKKKFEMTVEDKVAEGYKLETKTNTQAVLVKRDLGSAFWHIIIFLFTIWWTAGLGNLLYALYRYFVKADVVTIKTE